MINRTLITSKFLDVQVRSVLQDTKADEKHRNRLFRFSFKNFDTLIR
jgi:hypothetical protein